MHSVCAETGKAYLVARDRFGSHVSAHVSRQLLGIMCSDVCVSSLSGRDSRGVAQKRKAGLLCVVHNSNGSCLGLEGLCKATHPENSMYELTVREAHELYHAICKFGLSWAADELWCFQGLCMRQQVISATSGMDSRQSTDSVWAIL